MQNKDPLNKFDHFKNVSISAISIAMTDLVFYALFYALYALKDTFRNSRKIDSSFYNEAMLDRSKHFQNVHIDNSTSVTNAISLMGDE